MKVEITETGVYGTDGKPLAVGDTLTIKNDVIPANLINKCRVVAERLTKTAVTNPAKNAIQQKAD